MNGPQKDTGDLETIGIICKIYGWSVKGTGDLETIGMICKSYGSSVKRYRRPRDGRNDL